MHKGPGRSACSLARVCVCAITPAAGSQAEKIASASSAEQALVELEDIRYAVLQCCILVRVPASVVYHSSRACPSAIEGANHCDTIIVVHDSARSTMAALELGVSVERAGNPGLSGHDRDWADWLFRFFFLTSSLKPRPKPH